MASNVHKVPKHQWEKWNKDEQAMFNCLWRELDLCPNLFGEIPVIKRLSKKETHTMRWNVCWLAAHTMRKQRLMK